MPINTIGILILKQKPVKWVSIENTDKCHEIHCVNTQCQTIADIFTLTNGKYSWQVKTHDGYTILTPTHIGEH